MIEDDFESLYQKLKPSLQSARNTGKSAFQGNIAWPKRLHSGWEGVSGAVDCTSHPRTRVHPFQADFYRRDKEFNILSQITVGLQRIYVSS